MPAYWYIEYSEYVLCTALYYTQMTLIFELAIIFLLIRYRLILFKKLNSSKVGSIVPMPKGILP